MGLRSWSVTDELNPAVWACPTLPAHVGQGHHPMDQLALYQQGAALAELPRGLLIVGDGVPLTSEPLRAAMN